METAEQAILGSLGTLKELIRDLSESDGTRDNLSAYFAKTEGHGLGDARQMVSEKVTRVHAVTMNTNSTVDQITEIAADLIWLLYWVNKFNFTETPDGWFFIKHDLEEVDAVMATLFSLRNRFR